MRALMLRLMLCVGAVVLVAPSASAGQCEDDKVYAAECAALADIYAREMCRPSQFVIRDAVSANEWIEARKHASDMEERFKAVAENYPQCMDDPDAKKCRIGAMHLRDCSGLPQKFEDAWVQKIGYFLTEVLKHIPTAATIPGVEEQAVTGRKKKKKKAKPAAEDAGEQDPKAAFKHLRAASGYLNKDLNGLLAVEPDHAVLLAVKAHMHALMVELRAKNLDEIAKIQCPKAGAKNAALEATLMHVYGGWLSGLTAKLKAHKLRMAQKVVAETDWQGTKWEYGYTTTCIEELADPEDPARCSVQEVSFKRSKPAGKGWSEWSFHGSGALDEPMLCTNIK